MPRLTIDKRKLPTTRNAERGQSLVVAIIILFLLLFLGGIFIALIANNFKNTVRAVNTTSASGFADAGIRYLDEQLTKSPEGADWRPAPDNIANQSDPDYFWLKPYNVVTGEGGYTRINYGGPSQTSGNLGGRALVRVSYRPYRILTDNTGKTTYYDVDAGGNLVAVTNPDSVRRYMRLDSVGRSGTVDATDPTTFGNTDRAGLRRELVAYKAIGITDYMRFVTNKDNKPGPVALGSPFLVYDRPSDGSANAQQSRAIESVYQGPIRVNSSVQFYGDNQFYLDPSRNDTIEIAGSILLNNVNANATTTADLYPNKLNASRVFVNGAANLVYPSTSTAFTTLNGFVRDSPSGSETGSLNDSDAANRNLRSVPRLSPPLLDAEIGARGLTRYRALTRNAPPLPASETADNPVTVGTNTAGLIGWGSGLYVNNTQDVQQASNTLGGGYTLHNEWLNPITDPSTNLSVSQSWLGDLSYLPPAVTITFTPRYMIIEQNGGPVSNNQSRSYLRDNTGQRVGQGRIIRYSSNPSDGGARITNPPSAGVAPNTLGYEGYPAGDFVIYCEGNVRVRGVVGGVDGESGRFFKRNVTVVSNATVYVDGNLLRDNVTGGTGNTQHGLSSIALLAHDYVCVNTTQFLNPAAVMPQKEAADLYTDSRGFKTTEAFNFGFSVGPDSKTDPTNFARNTYNSNQFPDYFTSDPNSPYANPALFVRHSSDTVTGGSGVQINFLVNTVPQIFPSNGDISYPVPSESYLLEAFPLNTASFFANLGNENKLALRNDPSPHGVSATGADYRLTRTAIVPADIRIEAFMYAQEGSFFIIPGSWFNPNPNDTYDAYLSPTSKGGTPKLARAEESAGSARVDPRWPFYGQPLDARITFYGAIAENLPAEIGDQGAWLEKWGWVPRFYGSTGLQSAVGFQSQGKLLRTVHGSGFQKDGTTANPYFGTGEGIVYVYDPTGLSPYAPDGSAIRTNLLTGQPLPVVPRLPVAPGLLYFGENPIR